MESSEGRWFGARVSCCRIVRILLLSQSGFRALERIFLL